jgi:hypothetical protein
MVCNNLDLIRVELWTRLRVSLMHMSILCLKFQVIYRALTRLLTTG